MIKIKKPLLFLFGGCESEGDKRATKMNDMFIFDYLNFFWARIIPGGYNPQGKAKFGMTYNYIEKEILIIGGDYGENYI